MFPFIQSRETSPDCHEFSDMTESGYISQFPPHFGLHLIRFHRYLCVQVPQVVMNLIFSYSWRDFATPVLDLRSIHSRGLEKEVACEDCVKYFGSATLSGSS